MEDLKPGEICNDASENSNYAFSKDTLFNTRNVKSSAFSIDNILNRKDNAQFDRESKSNTHLNTQYTSLAKCK